MEDLEGLRFNPEIINSTIDKERFNTYLNLFDNLELNNRSKLLLEYINA